MLCNLQSKQKVWIVIIHEHIPVTVPLLHILTMTKVELPSYVKTPGRLVGVLNTVIWLKGRRCRVIARICDSVELITTQGDFVFKFRPFCYCQIMCNGRRAFTIHQRIVLARFQKSVKPKYSVICVYLSIY